VAKEYDVIMRRFVLVTFSIWFAISITLADIYTSAAQSTPTYRGSSSSGHSTTGYNPDQSESQALTDYLTKHKLPLVGAQVLKASDGQRMVVLYGFVGSNFGKSDAVKKTRRFLKHSHVTVDNHINVRPELLVSNRTSGAASANPSSGSSPGSAPSSGGYASDSEDSSRSADDLSSKYPGADSYAAQRPNPSNPSNPYAQQFTSMAPMIAVLGLLGMALAGGHSGFSFGNSSPFGSSPYGSPYSSPYGGGSPYGFGGSPYSGPPYAGPSYSSPYGNAPYGPGPYP
jgi:hypothetical protein